MNSEYRWELSRKNFVKSLLLGGVALQLPWLTGCSSDDEYTGSTNPLTKEQFKLLCAVQNTLFPSDGNGPGAAEINAGTYLLWVLNDSHIDPDENTYIIDKLEKFKQRCKENMGSNFLDLNQKEQIAFVAETSEYIWGRRWLSRLTTLIFEALLLDPQYGGNPNNIGWKWLNHDPGDPRPSKRILYPSIKDISHEI